MIFNIKFDWVNELHRAGVGPRKKLSIAT